MEGLIGLTKSVNDRESAIRDLSVLERMDSRIQQDKAAEIASQQQEQAFYEKMYQSADQMLEKDRTKINKKILMSQKQIRDHLDANGGSRKTFMENGGLSTLNQISNSIIHSDEAIRYEENKKNLAKILEAKEKGLGHLIAPNDLKSLEDYENNEDGARITYSGILNEIQVPPSELFDYGTEIPIENILSYGSNAIKIRQNYAMAYPDRPEPTWKELIAFTKKMGYGGLGSNTEAMRLKIQQQQIRAKYDAENSTKKNESKIGLVNELTNIFNNVPADLNVSKINTPVEEGGFGGSIIEYMKSKSPGVNKIIGEKSSISSTKRSLDKDGFDWRDAASLVAGLPGLVAKHVFGGSPTDETIDLVQKLFNSDVVLKDSYNIAQGNEGKIAKRILGDGEGGLGYKMEGGNILDFEPTEDMYRMDGVKLNGDNKLERGKYKGNYKIKGFVTALKSADSVGDSDMLLVDVYGGDGKKDPKASSKTDAGYTQNAQMTTVLALENEAGDIFYKEVNMRDTDLGTVVSNALGSDNDLTEVVKQQNQSLADIEAISKNTTEEQIAFKGAINTLQSEVFDDPVFKTEGEKYFGAQSAGQQNRYDMMKSFYMAFDYINNSYKRDEKNPQGDPNIYSSSTKKAVDNEMFTTVTQAGKIDEKLKTYEQGNSAEAMIVQWLENINSDLEPGSLAYKQNQELASKWIQLNKMM